MKWFDKEKVDSYIKMRKNYKTPELVYEMIAENIKPGQTVLELGSGSGVDALFLKDKYKIDVSDYSPLMVEQLKSIGFENALTIDITNIILDKKYDCIFSNKVVDQLNEEDFISTIRTQMKYLNKDGVLIHTLWMKNNDEIYHVPRIKSILKSVVIEDFKFYNEEEENDSMIIVLKG